MSCLEIKAEYDKLALLAKKTDASSISGQPNSADSAAMTTVATSAVAAGAVPMALGAAVPFIGPMVIAASLISSAQQANQISDEAVNIQRSNEAKARREYLADLYVRKSCRTPLDDDTPAKADNKTNHKKKRNL